MIIWILQCVESINPQLIISSFDHCGITSSIDEVRKINPVLLSTVDFEQAITTELKQPKSVCPHHDERNDLFSSLNDVGAGTYTLKVNINEEDVERISLEEDEEQEEVLEENKDGEHPDSPPLEEDFFENFPDVFNFDTSHEQILNLGEDEKIKASIEGNDCQREMTMDEWEALLKTTDSSNQIQDRDILEGFNQMNIHDQPEEEAINNGESEGSAELEITMTKYPKVQKKENEAVNRTLKIIAPKTWLSKVQIHEQSIDSAIISLKRKYAGAFREPIVEYAKPEAKKVKRNAEGKDKVSREQPTLNFYFAKHQS